MLFTQAGKSTRGVIPRSVIDDDQFGIGPPCALREREHGTFHEFASIVRGHDDRDRRRVTRSGLRFGRFASRLGVGPMAENGELQAVLKEAFPGKPEPSP